MNIGVWNPNKSLKNKLDIVQVNRINADHYVLNIVKLVVDILDGRHGIFL